MAGSEEKRVLILLVLAEMFFEEQKKDQFLAALTDITRSTEALKAKKMNGEVPSKKL